MKLVDFVDFRVPQPCASVSELPAALRRPQKKRTLDFWSMYLVDFVISVLGSPSPVHLCPSCLGRFGDLRTNTPLDFGSMHLVDFVIF